MEETHKKNTTHANSPINATISWNCRPDRCCSPSSSPFVQVPTHTTHGMPPGATINASHLGTPRTLTSTRQSTYNANTDKKSMKHTSEVRLSPSRPITNKRPDRRVAGESRLTMKRSLPATVELTALNPREPQSGACADRARYPEHTSLRGTEGSDRQWRPPDAITGLHPETGGHRNYHMTPTRRSSQTCSRPPDRTQVNQCRTYSPMRLAAAPRS